MACCRSFPWAPSRFPTGTESFSVCIVIFTLGSTLLGEILTHPSAGRKARYTNSLPLSRSCAPFAMGRSGHHVGSC